MTDYFLVMKRSHCLKCKKKYVLPTLQLTIIGKEHEMTSNVLTNAGKHVMLNTACAGNQ